MNKLERVTNDDNQTYLLYVFRSCHNLFKSRAAAMRKEKSQSLENYTLTRANSSSEISGAGGNGTRTRRMTMMMMIGVSGCLTHIIRTK